jgi:hypothetical protein
LELKNETFESLTYITKTIKESSWCEKLVGDVARIVKYVGSSGIVPFQLPLPKAVTSAVFIHRQCPCRIRPKDIVLGVASGSNRL